MYEKLNLDIEAMEKYLKILKKWFLLES
jgi:hypothetical protein